MTVSRRLLERLLPACGHALQSLQNKQPLSLHDADFLQRYGEIPGTELSDGLDPMLANLLVGCFDVTESSEVREACLAIALAVPGPEPATRVRHKVLSVGVRF